MIQGWTGGCSDRKIGSSVLLAVMGGGRVIDDSRHRRGRGHRKKKVFALLTARSEVTSLKVDDAALRR